MPLTPQNIGLITGGGSLIGQGLSDISNRKFAKDMYNRQRQDALADWTMQNEYNSPQAQMARLKVAGLNPNLVYGNGAANQAPPVRSSQAQSFHSQLDIGGAIQTGLAAYQDTRLRQAQYDNLLADNTIKTQEAALKAAQTASTVQQTSKSKFELGQAQILSTISLETAAEQLRKLKTGTDIDLQRNDREAQTNKLSLINQAEDILTKRAQRANTEAQRQQIFQQIENMKKDGKLKELDIQLKQNGIQPNDPLYMRILGRIIAGDTSIWQKIKNLF